MVVDKNVAKKEKPAPTMLEVTACTLTSFNLECVHSASRAFKKRANIAGDELLALFENEMWKDNTRVTHERIFIATVLKLKYKDEVDVVKELNKLICRLAHFYCWTTFPIVRSIENSN